MVVMSKEEFYETYGQNPKCSAMHHITDRNCMIYIWILFRSILGGSTKFFFPLSIVTLLLNYKKIEGPVYVEFVKVYLRKILYGACYANFAAITPCVLTKCLGRLNYYQVAYMPGLVAGLSTLIETRKDRVIGTILSVSLVLESIFRGVQYYNIFSVTRAKLTMLFVINNALLMHLLNNRNLDRKDSFFWIYIPKRSKESGLKCYHEKICSKFCFEGFRNYFLIGYAWNIVRKIISKNVEFIKRPHALLELFANQKNIMFGLFLGAYVGSYRLILCYLSHEEKLERYRHLIAGMLSGFSYGIQPNIQILCLGMTNTLQLLYAKLEDKYALLKKMPTLVPLYMFCQAILMKQRALEHEICPRYFMSLTSAVSGGEIDTLSKTLTKILV